MRSFFKQVLAVVIGLFLFLFTTIVLLLTILIGVSQTNQKSSFKKNSILKIQLKGKIKEYNQESILPINDITIDLLNLKKVIDYATKEDKIQGIYLKVGLLESGWASLEELREALKRFKKTGKFIVCYGEYFTQKNYYLAALADYLVLHPEGNFFFQGLSKKVTFYTQLLRKLNIKPVIFRVGEYKSAVEPYFLEEMSPSNRKQSLELLKTISEHVFNDVAMSRQLTTTTLKNVADNLEIAIPHDAKKLQMIDHIGYESDVEDYIKDKLQSKEKKEKQLLEKKNNTAAESNKISVKKDENNQAPEAENKPKINYVSTAKLQKHIQYLTSLNKNKNKIAVVIAEGEIIEGNVNNRYSITAKKYVKIFNKIKEDENIKAVVIRINSPGGSAIVSDILWHEINLLKEKKPIVASMSDIAASGGYYIAMACNKIFAYPTTITGSIGIWGLWFEVDQLLKKIGITADVVKTSPNGDIFNIHRAMTIKEKKYIQNIVNHGYENFITKTAESRKLSKDHILKIASGRVWSGKDAKENQLVDILGGFDEAIHMASDLANLEGEHTIEYFPKKPLGLITLIEEITNELKIKTLKNALGKYYNYYCMQEKALRVEGVQASLPYHIEIE